MLSVLQLIDNRVERAFPISRLRLLGRNRGFTSRVGLTGRRSAAAAISGGLQGNLHGLATTGGDYFQLLQLGAGG